MVQRRTFSAEFKTKVVLELIAGKKSLSEASREYEIKDTVLSRWKQEFLERAGEIFEQPKDLYKWYGALTKNINQKPNTDFLAKANELVTDKKSEIDKAKTIFRWVQSNINYVAFEFERDGNDPLPGLAESVGYVRGVMKMI